MFPTPLSKEKSDYFTEISARNLAALESNFFQPFLLIPFYAVMAEIYNGET